MMNGKDKVEADVRWATAEGRSPEPVMSERRYRRLMLTTFLATSLVAVIPLVIMTLVNYYQYREAFHQELVRPIDRMTSNIKRSLDFFLSDRLSALTMVVRDKSLDDLKDHSELKGILENINGTFGGFTDLGIIDADGRQISYAGPYELEGKNYREQEWFSEVIVRGVHISDAFKGHRGFPHFVIAVKDVKENDEVCVMRATVDTGMISNRILDVDPGRSGDAFIINRSGILQTPSRNYGKVLDKIPLKVPPFSKNTEVLEILDHNSNPLVLGYAYIENTPFIVMLLHRPDVLLENWLTLRRDLFIFLGISILLIMGVIMLGTIYMVNRIKEADLRRTALLHKMEYTNKMAAIGRLGAGVAHEINNPLAIINEKAGLMMDLLSMKDSMPSREKLTDLVDSILVSVVRCSTVTHRLLGFAKQLEVEFEEIDLQNLIKDVLVFLEKEASYRNIRIEFRVPGDFPIIQSDRGQLQQVFLNILNNAFSALKDDGEIDIEMEQPDADSVSVTIRDNGVGISEQNLSRIFEPFFTTNKGYGTGLGLSITYGIVEKLGGRIRVKSRVGEGTSFIITLPVRNRKRQAG